MWRTYKLSLSWARTSEYAFIRRRHFKQLFNYINFWNLKKKINNIVSVIILTIYSIWIDIVQSLLKFKLKYFLIPTVHYNNVVTISSQPYAANDLDFNIPVALHWPEFVPLRVRETKQHHHHEIVTKIHLSVIARPYSKPYLEVLLLHLSMP